MGQIKKQTSTLGVFVSEEQRMAASTDWVYNFVFCSHSFVFLLPHNDYNLKQNFEKKKSLPAIKLINLTPYIFLEGTL